MARVAPGSRRWNATAALAIVVVLAASAAKAIVAQEELAEDLQQQTCPQLERIVQEMVDVEVKVKNNKQIAAGFLRVFFHDCFSKTGCDASILLDSEWFGPINGGSVQPRVRDLVNEIRARVNKECGVGKVSCADILALATRDSVVAINGPRVPIQRGRLDGFNQADAAAELPKPNDKIDSILSKFRDFGLQPVDLVALSGGHTVGRTKLCDFVRPVHKCRAIQVLDVITPDVFDNKYFVGLVEGRGVFNSDQNLLTHPSTEQFVRNFAKDQAAFFEQWKRSMLKLSSKKASSGQIRGDSCNRVRVNDDIIIQQVVASA